VAVIAEPPLALGQKGSSRYDSVQGGGAAMANDCVPRGDAEFNAWQTNFVTPTRKAKPAGVMGAEIWAKIGPTPPVDPSELTFLAVDTRTPYTTDFDGADGGKQAHYMLRWVNTRGETGPWSETATATIGA
jgi:hypothetical protein